MQHREKNTTAALKYFGSQEYKYVPNTMSNLVWDSNYEEERPRYQFIASEY